MEGEVSTPPPVIHHISKTTVHPSTPPLRRSIPLTTWDLGYISINYIQKGILLPKPKQQTFMDRLISSLSFALNDFNPFAGRLSTTHHATTPPSLSVYIDCNDEGVEFTHATADHLTSSDLLSPPCVPPIVRSLFPLNWAIGHDGHSLPLFAVQATVLTDGTIFLGCSLNHAVGDGTSFWRLFNSWSAISRTDSVATVVGGDGPERWFLPSSPPPIKLPFTDIESHIEKHTTPELSDSVFLFSARSIMNLKSTANKSCASGTISSLQALLAQVWISVTRARELLPHQQTSYSVVVGCRSRLVPPLPVEYLGNSILVAVAKATAGELLERGLGWAAMRLNEVVREQTDRDVRKHVDLWVEKPTFCSFTGWKSSDLLTGSSPRFDVYGNDFGWGRPVAVRCGGANRFDGKVSVFPGPEERSMALEICLSPAAMSSLMEDHEFMHAVTRVSSWE